MSLNTTVFDFGTVEAPKNSDYIKPGQYIVNSIESTFVIENVKTPYIEATFYNKAGQGVRRKFYITVKALAILQYINEQMLNTPVTKAFTSAEAVGAYFANLFKGYNDKKTKNRVGMIVGKKVVGDKEYSNLIDFNFLVNLSEDKSFEEKEFTVEDYLNNKNLTMIDTYKAEQSSGSGTILNQMPEGANLVPEEVTDDLPF